MRLLLATILFLIIVGALAGAAMALCEFTFGRIGLRVRALIGSRRTRQEHMR